MREKNILVVDDEKLVCWSLSQMLSEEGYGVRVAETGAAAVAEYDSFRPDMVLLDVRLPDASGIDLLSQFKEKDEDVVIMMITAYADADSAVNALKIGADDYIGKPFNLEKIKHLVTQAFEKKRLRKEVDSFRRALRKKYDSDTLIGNSAKMIEIFKMIKVCAETDAKIVLIMGESGTGKQLVSRAVHFHSARSDSPFIEINCAAIPENLLENELFGHDKGAFTDAVTSHRGIFEAAERGTVFLDEIGDMPLTMQAKILKVIDSQNVRRLGGTKDREVDVRIIAATNQNLPRLVQEQKFRGDLFFRLNVMTIHLPPLRERKEDIPALVNHFIERLNEEYGRDVKGMTTEALECLRRYNWPGNVRELRNAVERAMMLEQGTMLTHHNFNHEINEEDLVPSGVGENGGDLTRRTDNDYYVTLPSGGISIEKIEKQLIEQALARFNGNQTKAAQCLQMTRDTMRYRIKKFGISGDQDVGGSGCRGIGESGNRGIR